MQRHPERELRQTDAFGFNEIRLSPGEWLLAAAIVIAACWLIPLVWQPTEPFEPGPDYRVPFRLGEDYAMFARYCRRVCAERKTLIVGDSVIWGHYVAAHGTLSHYLNQRAGADEFANLGVDGTHPAALTGLVDYYGRAIRGRSVVLFFNPLWISSPTHDLRGSKEFAFNHPRLVPQFSPRIPCYREPLGGRLGIVVERHVPMFGWVTHLRTAYFGNSDLAAWTLEHPYANPARAVTLELPSPDEPPSPRPIAEPWTAQRIERYNPRWVDLPTSLQWQSFQRTVRLLEARKNRVLVLVGPFNEHMLKEPSLKAYRRLKDEIAAWLAASGIPHLIPAALPSDLYADASHPLASGYAALARQLFADEGFRTFREIQ